jgi:PAS domain S-box-containing protein
MEARVAAGLMVLVALSVASVVLAASRVATRSAIARASDDLEDAQAAFYRLVDDRASVAAQQTRLIIALPIFRSVMVNPVVSRDVATLTQLADGYRNDVGAQFAIMTDPEGRPTAAPGWPAQTPFPPALQRTIADALAGGSRRELVAADGKLFLVTAEPAKFAEAELLGTVTFGFSLDDRVAKELAAVTRADVNLVSGRKLVGSSLNTRERQELAAVVSNGRFTDIRGVSRELRAFGGRNFVEGTFPLFRDHRAGDIGHLLLLQDWAPMQAFLDELRNALLLAGIGAFVITLVGGVVFSHSTTQPLMELASAARAIAAGDWKRKVKAVGSAEAITMATAFNDMTRSLREQAERLQSAYERFSTVTQSARDGIVSTDEAGSITFCNRSAEALFGYSETEVLKQPMTTLIAESDRASFTAALPVPNANDLTFGSVIEVTAVRKDGRQFPAEFSLAALHGSEGTTFTAVIRDVMDRKQAEDALRQRDEQLRQAQKMEAIGRLAGGVAHDFNNLLMAIHGYADLMVASFAEEDPRRSDAVEIVKAADRAAGLTRQLLAFSRRQVITQQAVALDQLVESMGNMLQRLIGPNIEIHTEIWPDLAPVLADSTQVEQILVNLVVNGRDAMPSGGTITIELRNIELDRIGIAAHPGLQPGDYVEMVVSDTGTGMDAETASRIFEPFFTTKEGTKGTGLGLATVYGIVQQNGGAIEVHSRLGHGTTFYIYLPRATDLGKPARAKPVLSGTPQSETVLLVEDDDGVRALIAGMLKKHGYTVLIASACDQALEIAARHRGRIHLLLTDIVMPGLNGRVLSERLAAARPDTRVLYMSGYSDDAILRHGVKKAAAYFIQKPFSMDALAQKVREALTGKSNVPVER